MMRISARLCVLLVTVRTSSQTNKDQTGLEDSLARHVDCRFWAEPKQSWATMIAKSGKEQEGSVFYFWDSESKECLPCTVCPERTMSHCSYVRDTVCVSQREWRARGLDTRNKGLDLLESRLRSSEPGQKDEGVVILRSSDERSDEKQPPVFGVKVYDTEDSTQIKDSPTRKVHRKYSRNPLSPGEGEYMGEEYFGTPTFFSEQTAEKDLPASPTLPDTEQPVLQVLHELLNSNKSQSVSVKDLVSVGHSLQGGEGTIPNYENVQHSFYKHAGRGPLVPTPSPSTSTTGPRETEEEGQREVGQEEEDGTVYDYNGNEYKEKFKEIWPYRTDDQYSLFYFHPTKEEKEVDEKEYPWPSLSENEKEKYHFQPRESTEQENLNQEVAVPTSSGSLIPLGEENENLDQKDDNTAALEKVFILVTSLVVILICVLIYVTTKTRYSQNRFKLLDNSDNVSSYQSVSPADTRLPLPASPSPVASSSSSQYDRSKLSIPLRPYSSSRSPSPGGKSPSYLDNNLIHPSVARSLRNIKQTNDDIQPLELELDLTNKLF